MRMRKILAAVLAAGMLLTALPVMAEETETTAVVDAYAQKLDASYTLALNAINAEDYETAKEYLNICFAYCDPQTNPTMYADLLLKRACIDVIEEKNDMALLSLDAALRVQPDLADAFLVRAQVYASQGDVDTAVENLEAYIGLTEDTSLYETVAQLQEANGNIEAAEAAYEKYVSGAGDDVQAEAGFQSGLYRMQGGKYDEAIAAFEAYVEDETYGAGAQYNIGICKMNTGDYAGAIEAFTACADKGGSFDGLYYNRGVCHLMSGEWNAAADDFSKSYNTESYKGDAHYNLAICRMQQGRYEVAVNLFTDLIDNGVPAAGEGDDAAYVVSDGAYYYRAVCYAALGKLDEALADYTTCIDHGYELAQSYYQRAQIYAAKGDTENQNNDLQASLKIAE